jgi:hypothetical protein
MGDTTNEEYEKLGSELRDILRPSCECLNCQQWIIDRLADVFRWHDKKLEELREIRLCQYCGLYDWCDTAKTYKATCQGFVPTGRKSKVKLIPKDESNPNLCASCNQFGDCSFLRSGQPCPEKGGNL